MKKFTLSVLTVCCAFGLTACSGGGLGSSNNAKPLPKANVAPPQTQNIDKSQNTNTSPTDAPAPDAQNNSATPNEPKQPTPGPNKIAGNISGHVQSPVDPLSRSRQDVTVYPVDSAYGSNKIKIDGREIDLALPITDSANGFDYIHTAANSSNGTSTIMISKGFDHVRFGTFMDFRDQDIHKYGVFASHFVFGDVTAAGDVPRSSTASYSGRAILRPIGSGDPEKWQGDAKFDVDFGKKSITGSVFYEPVAKNPAVADPIVKIPLAGSIDGASFSGTHNGNIMHGHFYGPQAAELGGTFVTERMRGHYLSGEKYITGAFGAAKQ